MQDVVYNVCRAWVVCIALVLQESKISAVRPVEMQDSCSQEAGLRRMVPISSKHKNSGCAEWMYLSASRRQSSAALLCFKSSIIRLKLWVIFWIIDGACYQSSHQVYREHPSSKPAAATRSCWHHSGCYSGSCSCGGVSTLSYKRYWIRSYIYLKNFF